MPRNPWKTERQWSKASRIAGYLWAHLGDDARADATLSVALRLTTPEQRLEIAKAADAHPASRPTDSPPSDETWEKVVRAVVDLQRAAQGRAA